VLPPIRLSPFAREPESRSKLIEAKANQPPLSMGAPGFGAAEGAAIPGSMTDGRSPSMSLASVAAESHTNSAIPPRLSVRILWTAIALLFDHRERTRATAVTT
jgi:hypothetical protein